LHSSSCHGVTLCAAALLFGLQRCYKCQGWATALFFATLCSAALRVMPQRFSSSREVYFVLWH